MTPDLEPPLHDPGPRPSAGAILAADRLPSSLPRDTLVPMKPLALQCLFSLLPAFLCGTEKARAEAFPVDWDRSWQKVQDLHGARVGRLVDGSLEIDTAPKGHVSFAGGEVMRDAAVTVRFKFLRAEDKYSGLNLYVRWNGDVWGKRDGFWIYLRPKFRSLHMQKVADGKLVKGFSERVRAVRPRATPLGEWMTLRCELEGRDIRVFLNGKPHLSVTDEGPLAIRRGRVAFGVGDAHVVIADLSQENLEQSGRIRGATYRYVNRPTRGDPGGNLLTDGRVNSREKQAFWRMLGARPEIVFDLHGEFFVTRVVLRAVSSPAVNISSADIWSSPDGQRWLPAATLRNTDGRRATGEHEIRGEVRSIARWIKLVLNRPAADQDVELAEVEIYGRRPSEQDREDAASSVYDMGPALPPTTDAGLEDGGYWYLSTDVMRAAIDKTHGLVGGLWNVERGRKCLERISDTYHLATRGGDTETDEYSDRVETSPSRTPDGALTLRCTNPALPDIVIEKTYSPSSDGRRLIKRVAFTNTSPAADRFLTHRTGAIVVEAFRRGGVYMGCDRGLGARLFARDVTVPRQIGALGARNSKTVILQRYDLGWGVGQFRHKINDTWCRPLTARYYEVQNHPPIYLPNGWRFGISTLHLRPGTPQSTEVHTALYNGRQIDFYGMWRNLPEVKAAFAAVKRPEWLSRLKASANISQPQMTGDQNLNLLPITRGLRVMETGDLWYLGHIHGVWGDWSTRGTVLSGAGARIDTRWLADFITAGQSASPRVRMGVYTWAWAAHPRSKVVREHPEWFISRDRNGQLFNAYSNMVLNHLRLLGAPGSMDEIVGRFADVMRDFGGDFFYLDGGGGGANLIDWQHLAIDYDYHWEELYRRIREIARARGKDKAVFFNARTGPYWDMGYYEGIDRVLNAATWRDSADGLSVVKIRQVYDPDQVVIPLYWRASTLPFFSNYCIGLGLTPSAPLGAPEQLLKLPYIEAAFETRKLQWLEADLKPDWRVDPETKIEAYALRHGSATVLSVIDHRTEAPGPVRVSADTRALGLDPERRVYAFAFGTRDIRQAWPALPEETRRQVNLRTGWGLDLVGRIRKATVIEPPGKRLEIEVPGEPQVLSMVILSHSCAALFSVNGRRLHYWAPEVLSARVRGTVKGSTIVLESDCPKEGGEAIVCAPPGKRIKGKDIRPLIVGDRHLAIVPLGPGKHSRSLDLEDAPAVAGRIALSRPDTAPAGQVAKVTLRPAPETALVRIRQQGVLVYAAELPVADGVIEIPVPGEAGARLLDLRVWGDAGDGNLRVGHAALQTSGRFEPDLPPWRAPKRPAKLEVRQTDVTIRGIRVIAEGIHTHDGLDGIQFAEADAKTGTFAGGMVDAPRTRYGYGFGGLELEKARILVLEAGNTFADAWTFNRGRESFKPQYTSIFGGMIVDYHTPAGYTKRVALGLGLLNPKRKSVRPAWGTGKAPDQLVMLSDLLHEGAEATFAIDLARWAPPEWDGRCWLAAGAESVYPSRRLRIRILDAFDNPRGQPILTGESLGDLYQAKRYAIVKAEASPLVDGRLDEEIWSKTEPATGFFVLGRSTRGRQETRAWITYDDSRLYIAFDCRENAREVNVSAEKLWGRDAVDIALNPSGDRKTFLQIIADATGRYDQFSHTPDGTKFRWAGVRVAASRHERGWAVEMSVPLKEMGLAPKSGLGWVGNFVRYRASDEMLTWSFMPGPAINDPARMAEFVFR